ncbi:MAG: hypothetical protein LBI33_12565 [Propionibacteriaceae bacterium]|jgi:hypothetical protein|nr:hypothetical protein [Propionibacteriaceae bacterium]
MKLNDTLEAGYFTIEPNPELVDGVAAMLAAVTAETLDPTADGSLQVSLDSTSALDGRLLISEESGDCLTALAIERDGEVVWLVAGAVPLAMVPVKAKYADNPKKRLQALVDWAATFSPYGVAALVGGEADDDELEGGIHLIADLPLAGITQHRKKKLDEDEWLDQLAETAEDTILLGSNFDSEVLLFDSSDDERRALTAHVTIDCDDEDTAVELVRAAMLAAYSDFTPRAAVEAALSVAVEEGCMLELADELFGDDEPGDEPEL